MQRRKLLTLAAASISLGIAGCTSSSDDTSDATGSEESSDDTDDDTIVDDRDDVIDPETADAPVPSDEYILQSYRAGCDTSEPDESTVSARLHPESILLDGNISFPRDHEPNEEDPHIYPIIETEVDEDNRELDVTVQFTNEYVGETNQTEKPDADEIEEFYGTCNDDYGSEDDDSWWTISFLMEQLYEDLAHAEAATLYVEYPNGDVEEVGYEESDF